MDRHPPDKLPRKYSCRLAFRVAARRWQVEEETRAPRSGAFSALILPPWVSIIERTMVNPIPIPVCLVEKK